MAVGRVGRRKLARLDVSHPYQRAFLNRGLVRTRVIDEEADPTLDQATMYAAGLTMMVMAEMADMSDVLENRIFRNMDMQDVRMNEVEREVELAKDEIVNNHDELLQAQVDIGDLWFRNVRATLTLDSQCLIQVSASSRRSEGILWGSRLEIHPLLH